MIRWSWIGVVLAVAVQPAGAQGAPQQPQDIVTFTGDDYELVDTADTGIVTLRIKLADGAAAANLDPVVVETAEVKARGLAGAFTYKDHTSSTIELTVDFARVNRPITYNVTVTVGDKHPENPPTFKAVTRTFKLIHPAAKARLVPESLIIERVGALPGRGCWTIPELALQETTGLSRLTPTGMDLRITKAGDDAVTAGLTLKAPAVVAMGGSGGSGAVGVEVTGDVPGGKVTGKGELRAPQMADAIAFQYELRSRVHPAMVAVFLVLGLGLGFVAKLKFHELLERVRLRREVAEIAKQAVDARKAPDTTLLDALGKVERACLDVLKDQPRQPPRWWARTVPADAALLVAVRDTQREALGAAVATWTASVTEQKTQVAAFTKAVDTPWLVPLEFQAWLDALRREADRARTAIERGDAASAKKILGRALPSGAATQQPPAAAQPSPATTQQATAAMQPGESPEKPANDIKELVSAWRTKMTTLAAQLRTNPTEQTTRWPEAAAELAPQIAARLADLLNALGQLAPIDVAALATWLANLHAVQAHLEDSAVQMESTWSLVVAAAENELSGISVNPLAGFSNVLPRRGADAAGYLASIAAKGQTIAAEFRKRLLDIVVENAQKGITDLVNQGKWSRAAADAKNVRRRPQGAPMDRGPAPSHVTEPPPAQASGPGALPAAAWPVIAIPVGVVDVVLQRTIRAERNTAKLTTFLSFLTLAVLYLVHYMPQSIGTWPELLAVLAQALTLDVSIDAVTQAVKILIK